MKYTGKTHRKRPLMEEKENKNSKWYQEGLKKRQEEKASKEVDGEISENELELMDLYDDEELYKQYDGIWERGDERVLFTREERLEVLKKSGGVCACCGKKLTSASMTVEHIIPISRGGKNDQSNLTALCYACNKDKGNMLFIPSGIYSAFIGKPRMREMDHMFKEWFSTVSDQFDIYRFPMVTPKYNFYIDPLDQGYERKRIVFNRQFFLQIAYVGRDNYDETEAITGINIKYLRQQMNRFNDTYDRKVGIYTIRKLSDDKILCLIAVLLDPKTNLLIVYLPWTCLQSRLKYGILVHFCNILVKVLSSIGGIEPIEYLVLSNYKEMISEFCSPYAHVYRGKDYSIYSDEEENGIYGVDVGLISGFDTAFEGMKQKEKAKANAREKR